MTQNQKPRSPRRRAFLAGSVAAVGTFGTVGPVEPQETRAGGAAPEKTSRRAYNGPYEGETLSRVAFPLGGMGAGMLCLEGTGALSHVSMASSASGWPRCAGWATSSTARRPAATCARSTATT